MEKWHYDGHGINDETGNRLLKAQVARLDPETQGINPDFDRISILAAAAPEMLEMLKRLASGIDRTRDYDFTDARDLTMDARALINRIESNS